VTSHGTSRTTVDAGEIQQAEAKFFGQVYEGDMTQPVDLLHRAFLPREDHDRHVPGSRWPRHRALVPTL
jgi:hypothetical protein